MTSSRSQGAPPLRRPALGGLPIRLDLTPNPYGPSVRVFDALSVAEETVASPQRERRLVDRVAAFEAVPQSWVTIAAGIQDLMVSILLLARRKGPLVTFPPTDASIARLAALLSLDMVEIERSPRFSVDLAVDDSRLPPAATAIAMSPNDPTGSLISSVDVVRLARQCGTVVVDERHGAYSPRSALPIAREFDNVVVVKTLETWAGLTAFPLAYAISSPRAAEELRRTLVDPTPPLGSLIAAEATLDDARYMLATVDRVIEEKGRLYRTLRKLNMVRPYPSWANFLLARAERGSAGWYADELAKRDIIVALPGDRRLEDYLRISSVSPEATQTLKHALIEIAAGL